MVMMLLGVRGLVGYVAIVNLAEAGHRGRDRLARVKGCRGRPASSSGCAGPSSSASSRAPGSSRPDTRFVSGTSGFRLGAARVSAVQPRWREHQADGRLEQVLGEAGASAHPWLTRGLSVTPGGQRADHELDEQVTAM